MARKWRKPKSMIKNPIPKKVAGSEAMRMMPSPIRIKVWRTLKEIHCWNVSFCFFFNWRPWMKKYSPTTKIRVPPGLARLVENASRERNTKPAPSEKLSCQVSVMNPPVERAAFLTFLFFGLLLGRFFTRFRARFRAITSFLSAPPYKSLSRIVLTWQCER